MKTVNKEDVKKIPRRFFWEAENFGSEVIISITIIAHEQEYCDQSSVQLICTIIKSLKSLFTS